MKKSAFILALIIFSLQFISCSSPLFSSTEQVTFILPDSLSPSLLYWKIVTTTSSSTESFTTTETSFTMEVTKNSPCSILAYPVTNLASQNPVSFYKPAGTIYPYDLQTETHCQKLSWENGFSASCMNRLIANGIEQKLSSSQIKEFISRFNWKKMMETITEKSQSNMNNILQETEVKFYNPWQIDSTKLLENLSNRNFSSSYLEITNQFVINTDSIYPVLESTYVPQNFIMNTNHTLTLKKDTPELLLYDNYYGAYICGSTAKNISLQLIYMPIVKEAL